MLTGYAAGFRRGSWIGVASSKNCEPVFRRRVTPSRNTDEPFENPSTDIQSVQTISLPVPFRCSDEDAAFLRELRRVQLSAVPVAHANG